MFIYHNGGYDNFNDLVELAEQVYPSSALLGDKIDKEVITMFGDLVSALTTDKN